MESRKKEKGRKKNKRRKREKKKVTSKNLVSTFVVFIVIRISIFNLLNHEQRAQTKTEIIFFLFALGVCLRVCIFARISISSSMSTKRRWALNPRKWFGTISHAAHKRDKSSQPIESNINLPSSTFAQPVTRIVPVASTMPAKHLLTRNKTQATVTPNNYDSNYTVSANSLGSYKQFHLPSFHVRREKTSVFTSASTTFNRTNVVPPARLEPSIPKAGQAKENLSIDTTRWITETTVYDLSKSLLSLSVAAQQRSQMKRNSVEKLLNTSIANISDPCFIYCPEDSSNELMKKPSTSSSLSLSSSNSSIDDNDERDRSSSSGIFTDERTDIHDHRRPQSKDTLSTIEILSIESINDSQTSLDNCPSRPIAHRFRLPITNDGLPTECLPQLEQNTQFPRSQRAQSAEHALKDQSMLTPIHNKSRQSSAAIIKKIEKRQLVARSPAITLEKAGFVRVANATYRLNIDKDGHLYRRQHDNSFIQSLQYEDSLPPANDEESYATLPRTSSTEQLNTNIQHDLRAIVDDYLRPMIDSVNGETIESTKKPSHHRSKRNAQINIDELTDKLLSSMDCSTYSQYQRCY